MRRFLLAVAAAAMLAPVATAQERSCGVGAVEVGRTVTDGVTKLRCRCAEGFKPNAGRCEAKPAVEATAPPTTHFEVESVAARGEAWVIMADGSSRNVRTLAGTVMEKGALIRTGPDGQVELTMAGGVRLRLGSNSAMSFEDPLPDESYALSVVHGLMELVEGPRGVRRGKIRTPTSVVAVRGTDVEVQVTPSGGSVVKLMSGLVDVTPKGQDRPIELRPGQMITVSAWGRVGGPKTIAP